MAMKSAGAARTVTQIAILLVFLVLAFTFLYPLYFMGVNSLKTRADYQTDMFSLPPAERVYVQNYTIIMGQFNILLYMRNSTVVVLGSLAMIFATCITAGYSFAKLRFPASRPIFFAVIATMFIPGQVTMIPMYVMFARMGLLDSHLGVMFAYLGGMIPSTVLLLTSNFRSIPTELVEALKMDGGGYFRTILDVILPMGKAAISIMVIFNSIWIWNDLFTPLILLQRQELKTVMVAISGFVTRQANNPQLQMTGLAMSSVPVLLVYLIFQKYIVRGITLGALK
jgi:raffinose/stachyose/melibiose transport system permease protein